VFVAAPYGYGKTTFARQLGAHSRGRLIGLGPEDLSTSESPESVDPWESDPPGAVLVDDVTGSVTAAADSLVRRALRRPRDGLALILCTRDISELGQIFGRLEVLQARASGDVALIGADELRFDDKELAQLTAPLPPGELAAHHGGWPLGSVLGAGRPPGADDMALCRAVLSAAPASVSEALVRLAPLRSVPLSVVTRLTGQGGTATLAAWTWELSPAVARVQGDFAEFSTALSAACSDSADSADSARSLVETASMEALGRGRVRTVREWTRRIPPELGSPLLSLVDASAAAALGEITAHDLQAVHDGIWSTVPELGPWASGVLSWTMVALGHARFGPIALTTLSRMLGGPPEPGRSAAALTGLDPFRLQWAAQLCMSLVWVMLNTRQVESRRQATLLWKDVETALARNGLAKEAVHAFYLAADTLTGGRTPDDAAALVLPSADASDDPLALAAAFIIGAHSIRCGDHEGARAALRRVERWAGEHPEVAADDTHVGALLRMQRCCVALGGAGDDSADRAEIEGLMESLWPVLLASPFRTSTLAAPLFATAWLDAGRLDLATRWWRRAADRPADLPLAREDVRAIEARIQVRTGSAAGARTLEAMIAERHVTVNPGTVAILRRWLVGDLAAVGDLDGAAGQLERGEQELPSAWFDALKDRLPSFSRDGSPARRVGTTVPGTSPPHVRLILLAPGVQVSRDGGAAEAVPGKAALLLAALVAGGGRIELDRAVDLVYPEADLESGRKRLHSTFHRIRRSFGPGAGVLVGLEDGVVRLRESPQLSVDAWELESALREGRIEEAVDLYADDFCSRQLAYEDVAIDARRSLRNRLARSAAAALESCLESGDSAAAATDLARRAWTAIPDDEDVCRSAARVLAAGGATREAREMIEETVRRLEVLGVDTAELAAAL